MSDSVKPIGDLRIALLGCGRMGRTRAAAVEQLGGHLEWIYDPDRLAAKELAGTTARVLEQSSELATEDVDALFVCTPPGTHGPVERACLARGVPVLIEKPLGVDFASAQRWVLARGEARTITSVGYMNRHRPSLVAARATIQNEGLIGLSGLWACGRYARDWWSDASLSGGPLNEQMTHLVDLMRWLAGEVDVVSSLGAGSQVDPETASETAIALRFKSGALGTLLYSCGTQEKGIGLRVVTRKRTIRLEGWDFQDSKQPPSEVDVFLTETRRFLDAVRTRTPSPELVDIEDVLQTQAVVDAIKQSLRGGGHPQSPRSTL